MNKCPFCGADVAEVATARELEYDCPMSWGDTHFAVVCDKRGGGCGAVTGFYNSPEEAEQAWNRRV